GVDRHGDEAGDEPPHGPAPARRSHRPRHLPRDHARAPRWARRSQVPSLPAAPEDGRRRLARAEDGARVLRVRAELNHAQPNPADRRPEAPVEPVPADRGPEARADLMQTLTAAAG